MKTFSKDNVDLIIHKDFSNMISYETHSINILVSIIDKSSKQNLLSENLSVCKFSDEFQLEGSRGLLLSNPVYSYGYVNISVNFDEELIDTPCQEMNITLGLKDTIVQKHISFLYIKK